MNRVFLGALAACAVFALTSFAIRSAAAPKPTGGPVWTVSQYPLDRAFRAPIFLTNTTPITTQMGAGGGIIITQIVIRWGSPALTVTINGVDEHLDSTSGSSNHHVYDFNPPLIVRPGDTITFGTTSSTQYAMIGGFTTMPGET